MAGFDWKKTLATVAPVLGTALGGPMGGMATKFIAEKLLGKSDASEEEIGAAVASAGPELMLKLKQADQEFKVKMQELGIKEEQLHAEDRASARQREAATGDSWAPRVLAAVAVLGFFGVLWWVLAYGLPAKGEIVLILIGTLTATVTQVFNYYFGSSAGSARKTGLLGGNGK